MKLIAMQDIIHDQHESVPECTSPAPLRATPRARVAHFDLVCGGIQGARPRWSVLVHLACHHADDALQVKAVAAATKVSVR